MADVVFEVQDLITLAGSDPDGAAEQFDRLVAQHGRARLAEALTAVAPDVVAASLAGQPSRLSQ